MKILIKAVCLFLTASIVNSQPALASQDVLSSSQGNTYQVIINNTCSRDIRVAVHYQHPDRGWVTQGWWEVEGRTELQTDIVSNHNQFYMHGATLGNRQWPPARSRKQYNQYEVIQDENFIIESVESESTSSSSQAVPFSLKEVSPGSLGLKARFDC
jgi:hypothetical protein